MKKTGISREIALEHSDTLRRSAIPNRATLNYLLFLIFPALICGCTAPELAQTYLDAPESNRVKTIIKMNSQALCLDVFTFENDRLKRLDSYQRFEKGDSSLRALRPRRMRLPLGMTLLEKIPRLKFLRVVLIQND